MSNGQIYVMHGSRRDVWAGVDGGVQGEPLRVEEVVYACGEYLEVQQLGRAPDCDR